MRDVKFTKGFGSDGREWECLNYAGCKEKSIKELEEKKKRNALTMRDVKARGIRFFDFAGVGMP